MGKRLLAWLLRPPAQLVAAKPPVPKEPIARARFNVYLKDKTLIYAKEQCNPNVDETIHMRFVPTDPDTNATSKRWPRTRRMGKGCGTVVGFPGYAFSVVEASQLLEDGGDWVMHIQSGAEASEGG